MITHKLNIKRFSADLPIMVLRLKRLLTRHSAGIIEHLLLSVDAFPSIMTRESIPMPGSWQVDIIRRYQLNDTYVLKLVVYQDDEIDDAMSIALLVGKKEDLQRLFAVETTPFSDSEVENELMEFLADYVLEEEEA